ncbi:hypothetical protein A2348_05065 [Candidatus Uhrbacteria bacterium RIFOXYB12_FULL_58_10]|nr:MAG: hypothetical protein A2348_05065 [Candidatus Uhrbacteria bacterium RIFOXYB12_FULL_58_10]
MNRTRSPILILQFRPHVIMANQEFDLIVKYSGRGAEEFRRVDTTREPINFALLDHAAALVLAGSGDYLISDGDIPEIRAALKPFLTEARARRVPTLGICFGGQLMTEAFDGRIENDESRAEVGTFVVTKTEAGKTDPLFANLPNHFDAQLGHKDHIVKLPEGAVCLTSSDRSANQAWRFPGEPVYALTFHPELDVAGTLFRVDYYAERYHITPAIRAAIAASLRESPEANRLVRHFLDLFVGVDNPVEKSVDE